MEDPELRDLDVEWVTLPGAMPGHLWLKVAVTGGNDSVTTVYLTRRQASRVAEVAASRVTGGK